MYLLLRADQRPKQNHEDLLLPAHLQGLYLSVKDLGLILSQKLIPLALTQCQNDCVLFFVMVIYFEKMMERLNFDPSVQYNVLIPNNFFEYFYHVGFAINSHSITNSGLIPGGQNLSKRQTVFFTSVDPKKKEHKDPNNIDLEAPRLAWYKQQRW